jgi:hypothetical protein
MIVLDEQLLGRNLESDIAKWYKGAVYFINDLRPNTVIKDDAVPALLRQQDQPTFVTINDRDFWRKVSIANQYGVVCFTLPDSRVKEISQRLRALLQRSEFNTKAKRMGIVIRVTDNDISHYAFNQREIKTLS